MTISEEKQKIRKEVYAFRKSLSEQEYQQKSSILFQKITDSTWYQEASILLAYISVRHEPDTRKLILHALGERKKIAVPKISGTQMEFYFIHSLEELSQGAFQIPEPENPGHPFFCQDYENITMLVPGVAFDTSNQRLGYGGGFYDRYLERIAPFTKVCTVGLCFKEQIYPHLPTESHDRAMSLIVSDSLT